MPEQFDTKYFRGQGAMFIGDLDANGDPTGLIFVGDLSSAELTPNVERSEVIENVTGAGAVGASWMKSVRYNLSMQMRSIKGPHLAIALGGTNTSKTGASVSGESHKAYLGKFIHLDHVKVSNVAIATKVEGTDFITHAAEGLVEIPAGSSIADDSTVSIDYDYATQEHVAVNPTDLEKAIVFAGLNSADDNKSTRCELYKVKLDPSVLSLITEESADMTINGLVQLASQRTAGDQLYSWKVES